MNELINLHEFSMHVFCKKKIYLADFFYFAHFYR